MLGQYTYKVVCHAHRGKGDAVETTEKGAGIASGHDKQELTLVVNAPRAPEPKTFTWPKTMKVGDAARTAATEFGYSGGNPGLQYLGTTPPRPLDNSKTLVAEHLRDGDELEIIDTGGGV